jgi:hypothetical protein
MAGWLDCMMDLGVETKGVGTKCLVASNESCTQLGCVAPRGAIFVCSCYHCALQRGLSASTDCLAVFLEEVKG